MTLDLSHVAAGAREQLQSAYAAGGHFDFQIEAFKNNDERGADLLLAVFLSGVGHSAKHAALSMLPAIAAGSECDVLTISHDSYTVDGLANLPEGYVLQDLVEAGRREEFGISDALVTVAVRREDQAVSMISQRYQLDDDNSETPVVTWGNTITLSEWRPHRTGEYAGGNTTERLREAMRVQTLKARLDEEFPGAADKLFPPGHENERVLHQICAMVKMFHTAWIGNEDFLLSVLIPAYSDAETEILDKSMAGLEDFILKSKDLGDAG